MKSKVRLEPGYCFKTKEVSERDSRGTITYVADILWRVVKHYDHYVLCERMKAGKPLYRQTFTNHELYRLGILKASDIECYKDVSIYAARRKAVV